MNSKRNIYRYITAKQKLTTRRRKIQARFLTTMKIRDNSNWSRKRRLDCSWRWRRATNKRDNVVWQWEMDNSVVTGVWAFSTRAHSKRNKNIKRRRKKYGREVEIEFQGQKEESQVQFSMNWERVEEEMISSYFESAWAFGYVEIVCCLCCQW